MATLVECCEYFIFGYHRLVTLHCFQKEDMLKREREKERKGAKHGVAKGF